MTKTECRAGNTMYRLEDLHEYKQELEKARREEHENIIRIEIDKTSHSKD